MESFVQSAARHLKASEVLIGVEGLGDEAVYLAGYVAECSYKAVMELYSNKTTARNYGHNIVSLEDEGMNQLRILYPEVDKRLAFNSTENTVLNHNHPQRRYFKSKLWTDEECNLAYEKALQIFEDTVVEMILDGSLNREELEPF